MRRGSQQLTRFPSFLAMTSCWAGQQPLPPHPSVPWSQTGSVQHWGSSPCSPTYLSTLPECQTLAYFETSTTYLPKCFPNERNRTQLSALASRLKLFPQLSLLVDLDSNRGGGRFPEPREIEIAGGPELSILLFQSGHLAGVASSPARGRSGPKLRNNPAHRSDRLIGYHVSPD